MGKTLGPVQLVVPGRGHEVEQLARQARVLKLDHEGLAARARRMRIDSGRLARPAAIHRSGQGGAKSLEPEDMPQVRRGLSCGGRGSSKAVPADPLLHDLHRRPPSDGFGEPENLIVDAGPAVGNGPDQQSGVVRPTRPSKSHTP